VFTRGQWCERVPDLFVDHSGRLAAPQREQLDGYRQAIADRLLTNTATTWQRLRDEQGLTVGLTTLRHYVHQLRGVDPDRVTVHMPLTAAGEVAAVEYAQPGVWTDPRTGKRFKVYAFVMTLCPLTSLIQVRSMPA